MKHLMFLLLVTSVAGIDSGFLDERADEYQPTIDRLKGYVNDSDVVFILGDYASKTERIAFEQAVARYPLMQDYEVLSEDEAAASDMSGKIPVYIGGPNQNYLAKETLISSQVETVDTPLGMLQLSTGDEKVIIISDKAGYNNLPKTSHKRSPLAKFIPDKYVPLVATAIGLGLLWLWKLVWPIIKKTLRVILGAKIMNRVRKKEVIKGSRRIFGIRFKLREWFSVFSSAVVFALAVTYSYVGMAYLVLINVIVNLVIYSSREFTRLYFDKSYKNHTEYVFWWWGGFLVIFTGWLGNVICLAGYTISESMTKRQLRIKYNIELVSFLIAIILLLWNFFSPSVFFQMASGLAVYISFFQLLPFSPFAGKDLYKWSRWKWLVLFIPLLVIYVMTHVWV